MADKPDSRDGYTPDDLERVRSTCLLVAYRLGDLMAESTIIGGLVPSLLIYAEDLGPGLDRHVGTLDLDLSFELAVLEAERYKEISERLRASGFVPGTNERGNPTPHRWVHTLPDGHAVGVDLLIPPSEGHERPGGIHHLEADFAAIVAPGVRAAFRDRVTRELSGTLPGGAACTRTIHVAGPAAFVVLKALAFTIRGETKDSYDLHFVASRFGSGPEAITPHLEKLLADPTTTALVRETVGFLERDFGESDRVGPVATSSFLYGSRDEQLEADVAGDVSALARIWCRRIGPEPG